MTTWLRWVLVASLALPVAGCLDDTLQPAGGAFPAGAALFEAPQSTPHPAFGLPTYTHLPEDGPAWWRPPTPRELPATVTGLEHVAQAEGRANGGGGIALFGSLAIVPDFTLTGDEETSPTAVLDIHDPSNPKLVVTLPTAARDVDTLAFPDGRLFAVAATGAGQLFVWDLTDPLSPLLASVIEPPTGTHNVAIVPGTPILYNANTQGRPGPEGMSAVFTGKPISSGQVEIYDLSRPDDPVLVDAWKNGYGCHDISFFLDPAADKYRAYCAGIEATQVWDIADPRAPSVLVEIPFFHGDPALPSTSVGLVTQSHMAIVNRDASVLVVGDETGSGAAPACDAEIGDGRSGPLGNLYLYDMTDETSPELVATVGADQHWPSNPPPENGPLPAAGCTAHFGRFVPHPDQDLLAMAWYGAGVVLVDLTDPATAHIVDTWNPNTNTWDVWPYQGYLFTGDMSRGLDVLAFD